MLLPVKHNGKLKETLCQQGYKVLRNISGDCLSLEQLQKLAAKVEKLSNKRTVAIYSKAPCISEPYLELLQESKLPCVVEPGYIKEAWFAKYNFRYHANHGFLLFINIPKWR